MPFHAVDITPDQSIAPCCKYLDRRNINELPNDFFNSDYFKDIQDSISQGCALKGCEACYKDEQHGGYSFRKYALEFYEKKFNKSFEIQKPKLQSVNIPFSNLCNNKCRMCNSRFSTQWYADEKALGWKIPKGQINQTDAIDKIDFSEVTLISFLGGEPMLNQDKIIDILKNRCNLEKLTVVITTNVTTLPCEELVNLLKQCARVEWDLSIDAYGRLNDFLRKGSDWEIVKYNLDWFAINFENLRMQTAISIYNVNCFHELFELSQKYTNIQHYMKLVSDVNPMLPRHLPLDAKLKIKEYVLDIKRNLDIPICNAIISELDTTGNFDIFEKFDTQLNNVRNENWNNVNPKLHNLVYKKVDNDK